MLKRLGSDTVRNYFDCSTVNLLHIYLAELKLYLIYNSYRGELVVQIFVVECTLYHGAK
jgi:hypothetical protein